MMPKDSKRISRTRRRRGYNWEDTIVKRFKGAAGWSAFRLGSPSMALPDVLAVSTAESSLFVIEAKSGASQSLYVPADQIWGCRRWTETFDIYQKRRVVLAFKFLAKKRVGQDRYESRKLREFFKVWGDEMPPAGCSCNYDGVIRLLGDKTRTEVCLEDCAVPFDVKG